MSKYLLENHLSCFHVALIKAIKIVKTRFCNDVVKEHESIVNTLSDHKDYASNVRHSLNIPNIWSIHRECHEDLLKIVLKITLAIFEEVKF